MSANVRCAILLVALSACGSSARGAHESASQPAPAPAPTANSTAPALRGGANSTAPALRGGASSTTPTAATAKTPANDSPRVVLMPADADPVSVRIEVAGDEATRRRGLMFRQHMDDDAGMLFLFEHAQQLTFWMRNTYIPLDMIFIESPDGASMRVLGVVEHAEPMTDTSRAVPGTSQYVLEVNAGWSGRHAVTKGTAVRFEGVPGF